MTSPAKKIAILTSGGDCAGLNAALRAVVLRATSFGWGVVGIMAGTHGLISRPPPGYDSNSQERRYRRYASGRNNFRHYE